MGPRKGGRFVDINCPAIPETLLEAELFGFERGAFTDARRAKAGLFQTAHRGTLFLDEVGLLPESAQAKLLKVIEERVVRRLGSTRPEAVDVCFISATNTDLRAALRARRFREDLYHRLAVITFEMPPLRNGGATCSSSPSGSSPGPAPTMGCRRRPWASRPRPACSPIAGPGISASSPT